MLSEANEVDTTRLDNGEQLYRLCSRPAHHHHLVCRDCGAAVEIARLPIERWADNVAADNGYVDVSHTIDIFGTCGKCRRRRNSTV
jgi:Fur family ferric uptake transcriptional regulator